MRQWASQYKRRPQPLFTSNVQHRIRFLQGACLKLPTSFVYKKGGLLALRPTTPKNNSSPKIWLRKNQV